MLLKMSLRFVVPQLCNRFFCTEVVSLLPLHWGRAAMGREHVQVAAAPWCSVSVSACPALCPLPLAPAPHCLPVLLLHRL